MRVILKPWLAAGAGVLMFAASASAEGAALVIGAKTYANAPEAVSAECDANAVAEAMEAAGYDVTLALSPDRAALRTALDTFAGVADDADRIAIFYAGHAIRMQGETFLAPSDMVGDTPVSVALDGVPLSALLALAATKPGAALVFVDLAEKQGFAPTAFADPGLAAVDAPEGVLIVSAAAPGEALNRNRWWGSDFAKAVSGAFLAPGAEAMDVAAGLTAPIWTTGAVADDFALVTTSATPPAPAAAAGTDIATQIELAFWQSTEASGTKADYEAYLGRYPDGLFAVIAQNRIGASASTSVTAPGTAASNAPRVATAEDRAAAAEAALGMSRDQRRAVQANLTELGYDTNGVDGIFGRGTRGALRLWQDSEQLPVTGYLTAAERTLLQSAANEAVAVREAAAAEAAKMTAAEARKAEDDFWLRSRRVGTIAAYQRYLTTYPDGIYRNDARTLIVRATRQEDERSWQEATELNSATAYDRYLDQFPDGQQAIEAQRRYDALTTEERRQDGTALARKEDDAWRRAEAENTSDAYGAFRDAFPDGRYAAEAQNRERKLVAQERKDAEAALKLDQASWRSIEQRLAFLGFDPGQQDGNVTNETRGAIQGYRRSRSMLGHRFVDDQFIQVLVQETNQTPQDPGAAILNQLFRVFQQ